MGLSYRHGLYQRLNSCWSLANFLNVAEDRCGFHFTPLRETTLSPQGIFYDTTYGSRTYESPIFGQVQSHRSPFASYSELSAFFNERCKMSLDANKVPDHHLSRNERFDDSAPLVFTHQDINPRNIIVGEDSRLWLIDWAWAGYYPPGFEYVAMRRQAENERTIGFSHKAWEILIPFICGPCFTQEEWLWKMSRVVFPVAKSSFKHTDVCEMVSDSLARYNIDIL